MGNGITLFIVLVAGAFFFSSDSSGQVTLSGTSYSQNFDTIGESLPHGWSVWDEATETSLGIAVPFQTNVTSWANTSAQFRNCASITNNAGEPDATASASTQHTFTNRVLAVRQGSSFGDPGASFVFHASDTIGLSDLQFSLDFLMLDEEGRETVWTVDYGFGPAPTNFTILGTYTNQIALGTVSRQTYGLGPDADDQPNVLTLRVAALTSATGSGSRDTFGIDNAVLAYNREGAGSIALQGKPIGSDLVLTWDDASFRLQSAPTLTGAFIDVTGAVSPHTNALDGTQQYFRLAK